MVKRFEMSSAQNKDGMRDFSMVLHEIYPEETFDEHGNGSQTNINGLAWREKWTELNRDTMINKSIRVEFINDDRSEIWGHGLTGYGADEIPLFENATVIGHFTGTEIRDVKYDDGITRRVLIGNGVIDAMCYPEFADKLESGIENGDNIFGSVEIMKEKGRSEIIYENGYHKESRTPQYYQYSGYAILAIKAADPSAVLLEINENKEEMTEMTDLEIKALIAEVVAEVNNSNEEINQIQGNCATQIEEATNARDAAIAEKNEIEASSVQIQAALDALQAEYEELDKKYHELWEEREALNKALGEAKARERIGEMNAAISSFTDEEKAYAKDEIDAFTNDPITSEINSVVNKIWEGIGKAARANEKIVDEQNSVDVDDIFGDVSHISDEDDSIF